MNTPKRLFRLLPRTLLGSVAVVFRLLVLDSFAGSATWTGGGFSSSWNEAANWTPATVPNGPDDIATFGASDKTAVFVDFTSEVNSIVFAPDAASFFFTLIEADFHFTGAGIVNNSTQAQNFVALSICFSCHGGYPQGYYFYNNATAGVNTFFTLEGADQEEAFAGELSFLDSSTAGSAVVNNLDSDFFYSGTTYFENNSSAEDAMIINHGSSRLYENGTVYFEDDSTAGHALIINNAAVSAGGSGGYVRFEDFSNSDTSTIICEADSVGSSDPASAWFEGAFGGGSSSGSSRIILHGNGNMKVDGGYYTLDVTVGSIEGDGNILLGGFGGDPKELTVGMNNRSTKFSGVIQDKSSSTGGSLTKIGTGKLILTNANTYTGGTTVNGGTLLANNTTGSGLGTGPIQVLSGIFGGSGTVAGRVTMGTGQGTGTTLAPGANSVIPGTLTIGKQLALKSDATYRVTINSLTPAVDLVIANGIRIVGAQIAFNDVSSNALPLGTTFTTFDNKSSKPISGTFANLPDGGSVIVGSNTFQANYEGGDGNDLTLTVVQ